MNIEVHILAVAILLLAVLAYGKELLVSLVMLFRTSRQNEEAIRSSDRNDDAASWSDWHLQDS
jgi:hypothetical protein